MKKLLIFFSGFLFFSLAGQAQNLVPNPSFEDTVACPNNFAQIDRATGWSSYRQSPDYFNACAPTTGPISVSVPSNQWGNQYARTGNAYAGLTTYQKQVSNLREYMGIQLSQPLLIGQIYYASFYVSRALSPNPYINAATNKLGMRLSTQPFSTSNWQPVDNYAQVYTDSIITDTLNWIQISGSFIADSAYLYLSIGNFFQDSLTSYIRFDSTSTVAYYYIEDVYLSTDTPKGILTINKNDLIKIFPNPARDWIAVEGTGIEELSLYNVLGKFCLSSKVSPTSPHLKIDVSNLNKGVYFINVRLSNENITRKLIIN